MDYGRFADFFDSAPFGNPPALDYRKAVYRRRKFGVVGRDYEGRARCALFVENVVQRLARGCVQARVRVVEQQYLRLEPQGFYKLEFFVFAARKLYQLRLAALGESEPLENRLDCRNIQIALLAVCFEFPENGESVLFGVVVVALLVIEIPVALQIRELVPIIDVQGLGGLPVFGERFFYFARVFDFPRNSLEQARLARAAFARYRPVFAARDFPVQSAENFLCTVADF